MPRAEEAIVLAGGLGTRLRSVVTDLPKPLASVAGRPFLAHVLEQLSAGGLRRVILATGYMGQKIEQVIGSRWAGMEVSYSREPMPLGTGGAVGFAATLLRGEGAHLVNGDTFLRYDPMALERTVHDTGAAIGIALTRVSDVSRYGAVAVEGARVIAFREKGESGPGLINAGSYFLTAEALSELPNNGQPYSFESQILVPSASKGRVVGFDQTDGFIDIGVPNDYELAQKLLATTP